MSSSRNGHSLINQEDAAARVRADLIQQTRKDNPNNKSNLNTVPIIVWDTDLNFLAESGYLGRRIADKIRQLESQELDGAKCWTLYAAHPIDIYNGISGAGFFAVVLSGLSLSAIPKGSHSPSNVLTVLGGSCILAASMAVTYIQKEKKGIQGRAQKGARRGRDSKKST
ncbi:hypothetical protein V8F06_013892 [Rhypophila decipiens]